MSTAQNDYSTSQMNKTAQERNQDDGTNNSSPPKSIVNMSDALDAGSAMDKQKSMRKIKEKMNQLTRTVYNQKDDPQFFLFLNRLADAEEFKKTDRIDGRRALDDFIVDKKSLMYEKGVKKAEQVKLQHQQQLKQTGQWKESDDDPFTNLKAGYQDMIEKKQTQETIPPKMIDMNEMSKEQVRTKNIIHPKPTINRGPKSPSEKDQLQEVEQSENEDDDDVDVSQKRQKMMQTNQQSIDKIGDEDNDHHLYDDKSPHSGRLENPNDTLTQSKFLTGSPRQVPTGYKQQPMLLVQDSHQQEQQLQEDNQIQQQQTLQKVQSSAVHLIDNNSSSQNFQKYANSVELQPGSLQGTADAHHGGKQMMHQSSRQIGISTLQLEAEASQRNITVSKRATNMSQLGGTPAKASSPQKRLIKPKSLVARIPIPAMDPAKAKQFKIFSTYNLSERSPLIKQEENSKHNMYARMPTIFAKNKDEDGETNSIVGIDLNDTANISNQAQSPLRNIEQLVEEGGSAAYQVYLQQSEKMLRNRLIEQNEGVFMANIEGIKQARNELLGRVMNPRNFKHDNTITSALPTALSETALEQEIKKIVERQSATLENSRMQRRITVSGYEDMKMRLSPRHARLSNHSGHDYLKAVQNNQLNILNRLESQIVNDENQRLQTQMKENTFGLGADFMKQRKYSAQIIPAPNNVNINRSSRNLSPIAQTSEKSDKSGGKKANKSEDDMIDPRYVVVFARDGDTLGSCKSFKMNIQEIISKYSIKQPSYMKSVTQQHLQMKAQFDKRAYKELLEYCSDHLFGQKDETDPNRRKLFKTLYTLDGQQLDTLASLRTYCEDPEHSKIAQKKRVVIHDSAMGEDNLNDRGDSGTDMQFQSTEMLKGKIEQHNKASFIFNPQKSDMISANQQQHQQQQEAVGGATPRSFIKPDLSQASTVQRESPLSMKEGSILEFQVPSNLNQSSTRNVLLLPNITRNESDMNTLKVKTAIVEKSQELEPKLMPKILLLSMNKATFTGLHIPQVDDEDTLRRENAKKMQEQFALLNKEKGNELYLEWLERNQDNVDLINRKMSLNIRANDLALQYSNDASRVNLRKNLNMRRYTTNATLQPPNIRHAISERKYSHAPGEDNTASRSSILTLPQIGGQNYINTISDIELHHEGRQQAQDAQNYLSGRWRSKAVLQAMEGVKRKEVFENLRKANGQNTISKKLATLNATPNIIVNQTNKNRSAQVSQASLYMQQNPNSINSNSISAFGPTDHMKPPTLKQLRMESIQRQIIEKTNAGLPIGSQAIDSSNIIFKGGHFTRQKCTFGGTKQGNIMGGSHQTSTQQRFGSDGKVDTQQTQEVSKNLTYDEVKSLSDEYFLPCKNVYELHAEYNSMLNIAMQDKMIKEQEAAVASSATDNEDASSAAPAVNKGIPVDFFLNTSILLKDKHVIIQQAILQAMGIHTQNKQQVNITWIQFLRMSTLLSYHCATKVQYIDFWMRFMNPESRKFVPQDEFEKRMELLARGSFTDNETLISVNYARGLYQMFAAQNCLSKDEKSLGEINMTKVKKRLNAEAIHIEYLNQTLKKECEFILDEEMMASGEIKIRNLKERMKQLSAGQSSSSILASKE